MCRTLVTPQSNLIAYYRLDEANGLTAYDASGNSNLGALQNFPSSQTNDWSFSGAPIGNESVNNYPASWTGLGLSLGSSPSGIDEGTLVIDSISGNPTGFHLYRVDTFPSQTSGLSNTIGTYFGTFVVGGTSPAYRTIYKYSGTVFDNFKCESSFKLKQRNDNSVASWTLLNNTLDMTTNTLTSNNNTRKEIILDTTCIGCPVFSLNLGSDKYYCTLPFNDNLDAGIIGVNYLWSTSASSKTISVTNSGTYWVEIGVTGCLSKRDTIILTGYQAPVISKDTTFCSLVNLSVDAGSGWSTYKWSNGADSQVTLITEKGQYNVNVSNAHCNFISNTINVNSFSAPSLGNDTVICNGTVLSLDAGNEWNSFHWSNGSINQKITVSKQGKYFVAVKNAFCAFHSDTINVNSYRAPELGKDTIICEGTPFSLNAGSIWNSYNWSNGSGTPIIPITEKGSYYVQVVNPYCIFNSDTINVDFYIAPDLGNDTSICKGVNFLLDAGTGWTSYLWSNGSVSSAISVTENGEYYLTVKNAYCSFNSDSVFINILNEEGMVFPNLITPNGDRLNDNFYLDNLINVSSIEIYNTWGGLIYKSTRNVNQWKPEEYPDGIYYYYLKTGCGFNYKGWIQLIR